MSQEEEKGREEEVEVAELIEDQKAQGRDSYFFDLLLSVISMIIVVSSAALALSFLYRVTNSVTIVVSTSKSILLEVPQGVLERWLTG